MYTKLFLPAAISVSMGLLISLSGCESAGQFYDYMLQPPKRAPQSGQGSKTFGQTLVVDHHWEQVKAIVDDYFPEPKADSNETVTIRPTGWTPPPGAVGDDYTMSADMVRSLQSVTSNQGRTRQFVSGDSEFVHCAEDCYVRIKLRRRHDGYSDVSFFFFSDGNVEALADTVLSQFHETLKKHGMSLILGEY